MAMPCSSCGSPVQPDERFCGECGAPRRVKEADLRQPEEEERRFATVLFADLAGFTSMSEGMDPEAVKLLASRCAEVMSEEARRFGGTITGVMGDAIMAVFGAPVAREDDPERAVRAGMAMRERIASLRGAPRPLELHIGINTGETMAGLIGPEGRQDYTAMGDTTNTAARLMGAAPTGSIYVGERTYHATRDTVRYEEVSPVAAKGKREPLHVWEVKGISSVPQARKLGSAALIGRQGELARLTELWMAVERDRRPVLATVVGPPGIGKSRLLAEFIQRTEAPQVLTGRCLPYGEGITYWPVIEILKGAAGILLDDEPDAVSRRLGLFIEGLGPEDPDRVRTVAAALSNLIAAPATPRGTYSAEQITQGELHWGIRRMFELLAGDSAVILVFEDLHWAEPTLLELLEFVLASEAGGAVLLLGSARPEVEDVFPDLFGPRGDSHVIRPTALSKGETEALLAELLPDQALQAHSVERLMAASGGNPLFLEETVRMLADSGTLDRVGGPATDGEELPVPATLQGLIGSRLDLLSAGEKTVAQHASVIGSVFWSGAVAHLGQSTPEVMAGLEGLERRDVVRSHDTSTVAGEHEYSFKHVLLRDVAYGRVPKRLRSGLHERCAAWISGLPSADEELIEIVAYHLEQACRLAREIGAGLIPGPVTEAVEALSRAAEKAERREGTREAERFYARALELVAAEEHPEVILELTLRRSRVQARLGELRLASEQLLEVTDRAEAAGRPDLRCAALLALSNIDQYQGRATDAREHLSEAETLANQTGDASLQIRAAFGMAALLADFEGTVEPAVKVLHRGQDLAEELGDQALQVEGHLRMGSLLLNAGRLAGAEQELAACIALSSQLGSHRDEARAMQTLGLIKLYLGDSKEAERLGEVAAEWLDRTGERYFQIQNLRALAKYALARHDPARAERRLREALPLAVDGGGWLVVEIYRYLTEALVQQGRLEQAREAASMARANMPGEDPYARAATLLSEAIVLTAEGRDEALERYVEALMLMEQQGLPIDASEARIEFARALRTFGDTVSARGELERARATFAPMGARGPLDAIERALAELAGEAGEPRPPKTAGLSGPVS